jgi:hypothetical protein
VFGFLSESALSIVFISLKEEGVFMENREYRQYLWNME